MFTVTIFIVLDHHRIHGYVFQICHKYYLQVLRERSPSCIARVHGDEVADGGIERDHCVHEVKHHLFLPDCILDALHLDGDNTENLNGDPVELVKAAPGSSLREALEDVATRLVVHLLRTVEHVDHDADGPGTIITYYRR